jgi:hypothetical protein
MNTRKRKQDYPEYNHYKSMLNNCSCSTNHNFIRDNIQVCPEWSGKGGFWTFLEQMGTRPSLKHKLFRKDLKKGFCKENCQWSVSNPHKRKNKDKPRLQNGPFMYKGKEYTLKSFCEEFDLPYNRTHYRINAGWSMQDVINEPNQHKNNTRSIFNKFHPNYWTYQRLLEKGDQEKLQEFLDKVQKD